MNEVKVDHTIPTKPRTPTTQRIVLKSLGFILIAYLYYAFLYPSPDFCVYNKDDQACFVTLAINLADAGRYSCDTFQAEQLRPHATWPFVFPLALASLIKSVGFSWFAIKAFMATLSLLTIYLLTHLWPNRENSYWVATIVALNPIFFLFGHTAMSEIPFMLACLLTLLCINRSNNYRTIFAASLCASIAFLCRGYAIAFVPTGLIVYYFKDGKTIPLKTRLAQCCTFCIPLLLTIACWTLWTNSVIHAGPVDEFTATFSNVGSTPDGHYLPINILKRLYWYHLRSFAHLLAPITQWSDISQYDISSGVGLILLAMSGIGLVHSIGTRINAVSIWLPIALTMQILFFGANPRYLLTYYPFTLFYAFSGIEYIATRFGARRGYALATKSITLLLSVVGMLLFLASPDSYRFKDPTWLAYRDTAAWCEMNLGKDAMIITRWPNHMLAATHRRSITVDIFSNESSYVVVDGQYFLVAPNPEVNNHNSMPDHWVTIPATVSNSLTPIHKNKQFTVYRCAIADQVNLLITSKHRSD